MTSILARHRIAALVGVALLATPLVASAVITNAASLPVATTTTNGMTSFAPIVAADGRSLARALRVAGKVDPVFVDEVGELAAAIVDHARDGDVVISMGAGSIAAVPARVAEMKALRNGGAL